MVSFDGQEVIIKKTRNYNKLSLYVNADGRVVVEHDAAAKFGEEKLQRFVDSHKRFLRTRLANMSRLQYPDFTDGGRVSLLGKEYVVKRYDGQTYSIDGDVLFAPHVWSPHDAKVFFAAILLPYVEALTRRYSQTYGLPYRAVKLNLPKTRWGSYASPQQVISYNLYLVFLPLPCVDYVVAHELCHSLHHDHSPAFWAEVARVCPSYKERNKALGAYSLLVLKDRADLGYRL